MGTDRHPAPDKSLRSVTWPAHGGGNSLVRSVSLAPFIRAGKAVFHVEYELKTGEFCPLAPRLKLSSMLKKYELGAWRRPC